MDHHHHHHHQQQSGTQQHPHNIHANNSQPPPPYLPHRHQPYSRNTAPHPHHHHHSPQSPAPQEVAQELQHLVQPGENDVLLGRSMVAYKHEGNQRFRALCAAKLDEYIRQPNRSGKTKVAQSILHAIHDKGGRFLIRDRLQLGWMQAHYKKARDKVGHTLRDACIAIKRNEKSNNGNGKNKSKKVEQKEATPTRSPTALPDQQKLGSVAKSSRELVITGSSYDAKKPKNEKQQVVDKQQQPHSDEMQLVDNQLADTKMPHAQTTKVDLQKSLTDSVKIVGEPGVLDDEMVDDALAAIGTDDIDISHVAKKDNNSNDISLDDAGMIAAVSRPSGVAVGAAAAAAVDNPPQNNNENEIPIVDAGESSTFGASGTLSNPSDMKTMWLAFAKQPSFDQDEKEYLERFGGTQHVLEEQVTTMSSSKPQHANLKDGEQSPIRERPSTPEPIMMLHAPAEGDLFHDDLLSHSDCCSLSTFDDETHQHHFDF